MIYNLMTKLFKKLIGGLKRLGTKLIHADFGRIVILTNKTDYASAKEYVDFILRAIKAKDTFAYLTIDDKAYWEQLVWMGTENWGGIPLVPVVSQNLEPEEVPEAYEEAETEQKPEEIESLDGALVNTVKETQIKEILKTKSASSSSSSSSSSSYSQAVAANEPGGRVSFADTHTMNIDNGVDSEDGVDNEGRKVSE
jgi:hypothetical protein